MHSKCSRCGQMFRLQNTGFGFLLTKCCENCLFKNLLDALNMPTPPDLLDRYTKHPTLTEAEWRRKLLENRA